MSVCWSDLEGRWQGRKALYLSWMEPSEFHCDSSLELSTAAQDAALVLRYDWIYEQRPRQGVLLLTRCVETGLATAAWLDSWHQSRSLLQLEGRWEGQVADVLGHYAVEGSAPWGWRMCVTLGPEVLRVQMYNRSPEGEESPAVDLNWRRVAA